MTGAQGYLGGWLDRRAGIIDPLAYTLGTGAHCCSRRRQHRRAPEGGETRPRTPAFGAFRPKTAPNCGPRRLSWRPTPIPMDCFRASPRRSCRCIPSRSRPRRCRPTLRRRSCRKGRRCRTRGASSSTTARAPTAGWCLAGAAAWRCRRVRPTGRICSARWCGSIRRSADVPIEKRWFGRVAMTPDHLPHIHEPEKGLLAVVGCQGRGVGLMSALGKRMAGYLGQRRCNAVAVPAVADPADPVPCLPPGRRRRDDRLVSDAGRLRALISPAVQSQLNSA